MLLPLHAGTVKAAVGASIRRKLTLLYDDLDPTSAGAHHAPHAHLPEGHGQAFVAQRGLAPDPCVPVPDAGTDPTAGERLPWARTPNGNAERDLQPSGYARANGRRALLARGAVCPFACCSSLRASSAERSVAAP